MSTCYPSGIGELRWRWHKVRLQSIQTPGGDAEAVPIQRAPLLCMGWGQWKGAQFAELGAVRIPGRLSGNGSDEQELGKGEGSDSVLGRRNSVCRGTDGSDSRVCCMSGTTCSVELQELKQEAEGWELC